MQQEMSFKTFENHASCQQFSQLNKGFERSARTMSVHQKMGSTKTSKFTNLTQGWKLLWNLCPNRHKIREKQGKTRRKTDNNSVTLKLCFKVARTPPSSEWHHYRISRRQKGQYRRKMFRSVQNFRNIAGQRWHLCTIAKWHLTYTRS